MQKHCLLLAGGSGRNLTGVIALLGILNEAGDLSGLTDPDPLRFGTKAGAVPQL